MYILTNFVIIANIIFISNMAVYTELFTPYNFLEEQNVSISKMVVRNKYVLLSLAFDLSDRGARLTRGLPSCIMPIVSLVELGYNR